MALVTREGFPTSTACTRLALTSQCGREGSAVQTGHHIGHRAPSRSPSRSPRSSMPCSDRAGSWPWVPWPWRSSQLRETGRDASGRRVFAPRFFEVSLLIEAGLNGSLGPARDRRELRPHRPGDLGLRELRSAMFPARHSTRQRGGSEGQRAADASAAAQVCTSEYVGLACLAAALVGVMQAHT